MLDMTMVALIGFSGLVKACAVNASYPQEYASARDARDSIRSHSITHTACAKFPLLCVMMFNSRFFSSSGSSSKYLITAFMAPRILIDPRHSPMSYISDSVAIRYRP
jgi:hypothetical protein